MTRIKNKRKKSIAITVSLLLVLGITIGGTIAFLMDKTDEVKNVFTPSKVTTKVEEDILTETAVKKNVTIKNTGDTDAYIRAAVVVTWKNSDGSIYGTAPVDNTDYEIDWYNEEDDIPDNWLKGNDGFYYYKNPVAKGASTTVLFTDCKLKDNVTAPAEGYYLNVEIIASGIQSKPAEAVETWSNDLYTIGADDVLTAQTQGGAGE